jgi:hypothetical protein
LDCICITGFTCSLLEDSHRGTCCWEFWAQGQETVRNPGAREPYRLFLAGWEVNQFGQSFRTTSRASEQHQFEVDTFYYHHYYVVVHYCYIVHYHVAHFKHVVHF